MLSDSSSCVLFDGGSMFSSHLIWGKRKLRVHLSTGGSQDDENDQKEKYMLQLCKNMFIFSGFSVSFALFL